jgi:PAS domain-containing protein
VPQPHMDPDPAAFRTFFEKAPIIGYVVDTDWKIVAVTDRLLDEIHHTRGSMLGKDVFAAFPDNPDDPAANGSAVLRASLERAFTSGKPEKLPRQRYDAPPAEPGGDFQERYWLPENIPVHDEDGSVAYVIHTVVDANPGQS